MTNSIDSLIAELSSPDRLALIRAVGSLKKRSKEATPALSALKKLLEDHEEPYIRLVVSGTISKIDPDDNSVLTVILQGLIDPNGIHRATACEILGERRDKVAVVNVIPLLEDDELTVKFAAAKALGRTFGDWKHAVSVCLAMLTDASETIRAMGQELLLSVRHHVDDLEPLTTALGDCDWMVRLDIEEVLAVLRRQ